MCVGGREVGERDAKLLYVMRFHSATTRCRKYCSSWHGLLKLLFIDKHVLIIGVDSVLGVVCGNCSK